MTNEVFMTSQFNNNTNSIKKLDISHVIFDDELKFFYQINLRKKKTSKNEDFLLETPGHIFRIFDFMIFDGLKTTYIDTKLFTVPFQSKNPKVLLCKDNQISNRPYNRVDIIQGQDPLNLLISDLSVNLLTEEEKSPPIIPNCIFQSITGLCYICEKMFTLDFVNNSCDFCIDYYIDFLKKCVNDTYLLVDYQLQINPLSIFSLNLRSTFNAEEKNRDFEIISSLDLNKSQTSSDIYTVKPFVFSNQNKSYQFVNIIITNVANKIKNNNILSNPFFCLNFNMFDALITNINSKLSKYEKSNYHRIFFGFSFINDYETSLPSLPVRSFNVSFSRKNKTEKEVERTDNNIYSNFNTFEISQSDIFNLLDTDDNLPEIKKIPFTADIRFVSDTSIKLDHLFYAQAIPNNFNDAAKNSFPFTTNVNIDVSYYYSDDKYNIKLLCSDNCLDCESQKFCNVCIEGYYRFNNECLQCSPQCHTCENNADHCTKCSGTSPTIPLEIKRGNCLSSSSFPNCLEINNTDTECLKCQLGYHLVNSQCETIKDINPIVPIVSKQPLIYPLEYKSGVFKDSTSPTGFGFCIDGCSFCSNSHTCELCLKEYYLFEGKCFKCPPNCSKCFNSFVCNICYPGYFLDNDRGCLESFYSRNNISQTTDGIAEKESFVNSPKNSIIKEHVIQKEIVQLKEIEGCTVYSVNHGNCVRCRPDYYRHFDECKKCMIGCAYCDKEHICLACDNNYTRLQKDGRIFCQEVEVNHIT